MFVVCCITFRVYCRLSIVYGLLFIVCFGLRVVKLVLPIVYGLFFIARCLSRIVYCPFALLNLFLCISFCLVFICDCSPCFADGLVFSPLLVYSLFVVGYVLLLSVCCVLCVVYGLWFMVYGLSCLVRCLFRNAYCVLFVFVGCYGVLLLRIVCRLLFAIGY